MLALRLIKGKQDQPISPFSQVRKDRSGARSASVARSALTTRCALVVACWTMAAGVVGAAVAAHAAISVAKRARDTSKEKSKNHA